MSCIIIQTFGQEFEPWYQGLNHFGPTASEGWNARRMNVTGPYTFAISNITVFAGQEFMFVSVVNSTVVPPLGPLNWKQGKIGVGPMMDWEGGNAFYFKALPGGGAGRYPANGTCTIIVRTGSDMEVEIVYNSSGPLALATHIFSDHSVTEDSQTSVLIGHPGPFNQSLLWTNNARVIGFSSSSAALGASAPNVSMTRVNLEVLNGQSVVSVRYNEAHYDIFISDAVLRDGHWSPLVNLRDDSTAYRPQDQPRGGWHVTPIHANYLPLEGKVLITGWLRRDSLPCFGGPDAAGRRRAGISFLLDPANIPHGGDLYVDRVDENAEIAFGDNTTLWKGFPMDGDAIYCAGHCPLSDGRVFFFGGGRYAYTSTPFELEYGLDYARLYDPNSRTFTRVSSPAPLGTSWYPTTTRLPDGRILVAGGFSSYSTPECLGDSCLNPSINIFDPTAFDNGTNPWTVWIDSNNTDPLINPGVREYTRMIVLPEPLYRNGCWRHLLLMGKAGAAILMSMDPACPRQSRLFRPPNGLRPTDACAENKSEQSTAVPLVTFRGGELLVIGGCATTADLYNADTDSWKSVELGIRRNVPAGIILPTGEIAVFSGEPVDVDQIMYSESDAPRDSRYVQIIDPETLDVYTESARSDVYRGYHNMVVLLPCGRLVVGGGYSQYGDVGCEEDNLQVFTPSYLNRGPRPQFQDEGDITAKLGSVIRLSLEPGTTLHASRPVAIMAATAFTHSYDQNQRYVLAKVLDYNVATGDLTIAIPSSPSLFSGVYMLFIMSDAGAVSFGRTITLLAK